jgi:hypothetical protein
LKFLALAGRRSGAAVARLLRRSPKAGEELTVLDTLVRLHHSGCGPRGNRRCNATAAIYGAGMKHPQPPAADQPARPVSNGRSRKGRTLEHMRRLVLCRRSRVKPSLLVLKKFMSDDEARSKDR